MPPDAPVDLHRSGRGGTRNRHGWSWFAVDARDGTLLQVASYETMEVCAEARWEVERDRYGFILVKPVKADHHGGEA